MKKLIDVDIETRQPNIVAGKISYKTYISAKSDGKKVTGLTHDDFLINGRPLTEEEKSWIIIEK